VRAGHDGRLLTVGLRQDSLTGILYQAGALADQGRQVLPLPRLTSVGRSVPAPWLIFYAPFLVLPIFGSFQVV